MALLQARTQGTITICLEVYLELSMHNLQLHKRDTPFLPFAGSFISSRQGNPKTFRRCTGDDNIGQVFLSSQGLNYDGFYKEAAIIDQRLAVSMSMGFVAIKKPTRGNCE